MDTEIITAMIGAAATIAAAFIGIRVGRRPQRDDPVRSHSPEVVRRPHKYDVFVSAPLAGYTTDEEILADHNRVAPLVEYFENELGFKVFWAGRNIRRKADFEAQDIASADDVKAVIDSKYFVLLYPHKVASSVLFEAGIALRSCLVSIYIVQNRDDLPFLMSSAPQAFINVRTYEVKLPDDALTLIRKHGKNFFDAKRVNIE